jgi:hypothetical protein
MPQEQTKGPLDRPLHLRGRLIPIIRQEDDPVVRPAVAHVEEPSDQALKQNDKSP